MIVPASAWTNGGLHFCPNGRWDCGNGSAPIVYLSSTFLFLVFFFFRPWLVAILWCCNPVK